MRVTISFVGLLLLSCVVGCEGNGPRRSPLAASSSPASAKKVEFAPASKGAGTSRGGDQGNNAGNNPNPPVRDLADIPDPDNDVGKMVRNRKTDFGLPFAIFERKEVPKYLSGSIEQNLNFVTRTQQGLDFLLLRKAISEFRANNDRGEAPKDVGTFLNMLIANNINLPELKENEFYIYDPELAGKESSKENLDFLQQYSP